MFGGLFTQDGKYIDPYTVLLMNSVGPFTRPIETSDDEYSHMLNNAAA